jgi:adenosine deaminase
LHIFWCDRHHLPVVAIDIAGAERDYQATEHKEAFELAHHHSFGKTVHAGEGFGPESIWQAVRDLHAERIGHGFHLFAADKVCSVLFWTSS